MSALLHRRTLGRSGLVVSPLALGTMTFGNSAWGSSDADSAAVFNAYVDAGGNFIDTADVYSNGRSEALIGQLVAERSLRDGLVIATKASFQGGNGRKNLQRALESSLKRLRMDSVDLFWLHTWDRVTPVEEVLQTMGDFIRAGKIRYFGLSDVPAWYAAKATTLGTAHGVPGPIALQLEYSLAERSIEREHLPAAQECGLGLCTWSPLAGGFLAGSYQRAAGSMASRTAAQGAGRYQAWPAFKPLTDAHWLTLDALRGVAAEAERPLAQVALAWVRAQPGITAPIVGARTVAHWQDHLAALSLTLSADQRQKLDAASALASVHPYNIFSDEVQRLIFGGQSVSGWHPHPTGG